MKLRRHQDADETLLKGPNFEADACTRFLGPIGSAYLLVIRAQVDMAAGRLASYTIKTIVLLMLSVYSHYVFVFGSKSS